MSSAVVVRSRRPPSLATWLLENLLPEESRETVIGDLVEQWDNGEIGRAQFWRETLAALAQLQLLPFGATSFTPYTRETHMQAFLTDLRYAARVLSRARGFTAICVATLAIAIGATTAIYSIANPILIESLPYPDADRLVLVQERDASGIGSRTGYATYTDVRARTRSIESAAAVSWWDATFIGTHDAERVLGSGVSWQYFQTLGVRPALGRDFLESDDVVNGPQRVIISHGLWQRRYGGDVGAIGKEIDINGVPRTLVGVMPPDFEDVVQPTAQAWRILRYGEGNSSSCRSCRHLQFVARLRDGVARDRAEREIDGILQQLGKEYPSDYVTPGAVVPGLQERVAANAKPVLLALLGAVALLLLIAIANVINLQLARAVRRDEEFAVRAALGAGSGHIARQLVAEGLVLATLGGVAGVALAWGALPFMVSRLPASIPRLNAVHVDMNALMLVVVIVLAVSMAVGLAPALRTGRQRLFDTLRGARTVGLAHRRLRGAIVVGEVALAMMLLAGVGLLGRSLSRLLDVETGFDASNLVTMEIVSVGAAYNDTGATRAMHDRVREAVRALPGVLDVGLTTQLPLSGSFDQYGVSARDKPLDNPSLAPSADRYTVTWDFMRTMKIPVLRGRAFTEAEGNDTTNRVTVVSDGLAKRLWPGEDPIGKQIKVGGPLRPWWTVIGVAANVAHVGLDAPSSQVYVLERQWWNEETMTLAARVRGDPALVANAVREAVRAVDPLQPVPAAATMGQVVARSTAQRRLGLLLFVAFGAIALMLATAGIYGVLAGSVTERTREFGVRSALGATPGAIAAMVLREGATLAVIGLVIGVVSALGLSRYLRALLYGVEPSDPLSLGFGVLAIGVVALLACVIPARRATRVDPTQALRE